jgi:Mycotoxin biosynthesis protein UstYa
MYVTPTWNFYCLYQINSDNRTAVGISRINGVDAAQLPNFTTAIPNMLDSYVVELDVFHQLHCLNAIRKTLFPLRYPDQFTDFYTKEGQRNYTSNDARHYGEAL